MLDIHSRTPLYIQISNWIESEILKGNFPIDGKVYSQYQLAERFHVNPATAAKGLTRLSEQGILYDRRGLGKFVSAQAISIIHQRRKEEELIALAKNLVKEAVLLDLEAAELLELVAKYYTRARGGSDHDRV